MGNKDCGLFNEFGSLPLFLACVRKAVALMARLPKAGIGSRMEKPCLPGKDREWAMQGGDGLPRKAVRAVPAFLIPIVCAVEVIKQHKDQCRFMYDDDLFAIRSIWNVGSTWRCFLYADAIFKV